MSRKVTATVTNSRLIPANEWHPLNGVPAPEYIPARWTGPHVGARLADGFRTLAKLPGTAPAKVGFWPAYSYEWEDLLAQREADIDTLEMQEQHQNRVRLMPSAEEISRMEIIIGWVPKYLKGWPIRARIVQRVALCRARDLSLWVAARRMRHAEWFVRQQNDKGLARIANGLEQDGVTIF